MGAAADASHRHYIFGSRWALGAPRGPSSPPAHRAAAGLPSPFPRPQDSPHPRRAASSRAQAGTPGPASHGRGHGPAGAGQKPTRGRARHGAPRVTGPSEAARGPATLPTHATRIFSTGRAPCPLPCHGTPDADPSTQLPLA